MHVMQIVRSLLAQSLLAKLARTSDLHVNATFTIRKLFQYYSRKPNSAPIEKIGRMLHNFDHEARPAWSTAVVSTSWRAKAR